MCYLTGFLSHNSYDLDFHKFGVPFHLQHYLFRGGDSWSIIFFYLKGSALRSACDRTFKYSLPFGLASQLSRFLSHLSQKTNQPFLIGEANNVSILHYLKIVLFSGIFDQDRLLHLYRDNQEMRM